MKKGKRNSSSSKKTKLKKAILIDVVDMRTTKEEAAKRLEELENLVNTYGGIVVIKAVQKRGTPNYATFIGKGKVKEILEAGKEKEADLVIINNILKPRQIFNLNEEFRKVHIKTWDRIDLILKIFARHAESTEAKLQIELASIRHMGPRIFGMGIELSRQGGAVGLRSGGGEANIEMMKRHLQRQELSILKKLKHYEIINQGHRIRRRRQNFKTVSLVGYTNVGKSSIMNALTGKDVYVADELFATLSTRVGKLYISNRSEGGEYLPGREILVADTIGFIQNLPPSLIQAFKSTLAETMESDLILHIIDINDPEIHKKIEVVEDILNQLGLEDKPKIYGFNKIDIFAPRSIFDKSFANKQKKRQSLLKAGKDTAELLGWVNTAQTDIAKKKKKKLIKKYKKFSPIFVSATEKRNLEELIQMISQNL